MASDKKYLTIAYSALEAEWCESISKLCRENALYSAKTFSCEYDGYHEMVL